MKRRIFFLEGNRDGTVGGSYHLMYDLIRALDREQYMPVAGFHVDNLVADRLRRDGVETHIFEFPQPFTIGVDYLDGVLAPVRKGVNFFKRFMLPALRYARFLRSHQIDLVNLNNSINRNFSWMLAAMISRTKCMTHEMGINDSFPFAARFFGKRLESIVCLSHAIHDNMIKKGVGYPQSEVIHCGIDLSRYRIKATPAQLRERHSIGSKDPVIGVVGNIKYWKGQDTIVRATGIIKEKYPNIRCLLVGDCSPSDLTYKAGLLEVCKRMSIADNVLFTGFQENAIDYMNLMDIVVHTSVLPEPFGIVTLEAMSLAKPLVSTDIGGPTEVVVDGETGLLVTPGQPERLAAALLSLLSHMDKARQMGLAGKDRLQKEFAFEKSMERTMRVYDRIFSDHK